MTRHRIPDALILVSAIYCVGVAMVGVARVGFSDALAGSNLVTIGSLVVIGLALALALLLPRSARTRLALVLGGLCAGVFFAELLLTVTGPSVRTQTDAERMWAARFAGRPIDHRTRADVIRDLRARGVDAMPFAGAIIAGEPGATTIADVHGSALPILGGVSVVPTVFCNESGQHEIYTADEYGFNNPRGSHRPASVEVALLGDSFTQGTCVPPEASLAGRVRAVFPDTLNLGVSGSGPLSEFARFVEYAAPLRPRVVVWNWFEGNDLADLRRETMSAPLRRYLTGTAPLGLKARQAEIDRALRARIDSGLHEQTSSFVRRFLLLRALRTQLPIATLLRPGTAAETADGHHFHEELAVAEGLLKTVRNTTRSWGGRLVAVYLPASQRYCDEAGTLSWRRFCALSPPRSRAGGDMYHRNDVLAMFARLGVPVVDGHAAFAATKRPTEMFYYPNSHYTPMGYRVIAEPLLQELDRLVDPMG